MAEAGLILLIIAIGLGCYWMGWADARDKYRK